MKATLWLCSLVTTLVCVSQQVAAEPYSDTRIIQPQDNSLVAPAKRTKPSLSIVNPLDVLRQRIILEMARRQMRENTRQVERNKAILREIGKRSHGEFHEDESAPRFGVGRQQDDFFYQKLPFLRRYEPSNGERQLDVEEYELEPTDARKSTSSGSSSRNTNNSSLNGSGKQINERQQISTAGGSSSRSSSNDNRGGLTLAQEQRQLEREQQQEAAAAIGQQELRFSDDRVMLPASRTTDERREGGDGDDEYFESSNLLKESEQERQHQQQQQQDDKLKSDDYRLRYLYNIQDKLFG